MSQLKNDELLEISKVPGFPLASKVKFMVAISGRSNSALAKDIADIVEQDLAKFIDDLNENIRIERDGNDEYYWVRVKDLYIALYKDMHLENNIGISSTSVGYPPPRTHKLDKHTFLKVLNDIQEFAKNMIDIVANRNVGLIVYIPKLQKIVGFIEEKKKELGLSENSGGTAKHKQYKGRNYLVRTGSRGGKYMLVKGKKVYVQTT